MLLEVCEAGFGYEKERPILRNVNLNLERGHILAVLGPNGIGKTTMLKCIIGLLSWDSGQTLLEGTDICTMSQKELWRNISYIPQKHGFSFSYTGLEMVMMGRSTHLGTFEQPGKREIGMAEDMMEHVGISHLKDKDCNRMSGGELQMVLIAKALINEPKLIVLDEPETGLDFRNQLLVLNRIRSLAEEEGISAIMNTHYPSNAVSVADNALLMKKGGESLYGRAEEVLTAEHISEAFRVKAVVNSFGYENREITTIVPVELQP